MMSKSIPEINPPDAKEILIEVMKRRKAELAEIMKKGKAEKTVLKCNVLYRIIKGC